jgi:hypothetical protein
MTLDKVIAEKLTHEQVLDFDSLQLEKLTDEQLMLVYGNALNVTRPEYAGRVVDKKEQVAVYIPPAKKRAIEMLQAEGMDLSYLNKRRKR